MLKFGIISEAKPGYGKVQFQEDDIVSDWLPVAVQFGLDDKAVWTLKIQQQVACLMDDQCETGVIIGATYNDTDTAPSASNLFLIQFEDGTKLQYNKSSHELKADVKGKVTVLATDDVTITGSKNINATATQKITLNAPEADITAPIMKFTGAMQVVGEIAAGGITITSGLGGGSGKMTGDGDIETTGIIKGGTVKQGTVELGSHVHSGVTTGAGTSGPPVP